MYCILDVDSSCIISGHLRHKAGGEAHQGQCEPVLCDHLLRPDWTHVQP